MIRRLGLLLLGIVSFSLPALAQECLVMDSTTLVNTYNMCESVESIERALGSQIIQWNGGDNLVADLGNELKIWSIEVPGDPSAVDDSYFDVGNAGDSDYDLLNFSVCDDCRWGVANFKAGTVLFDLGTGATPFFTSHTFYSGANLVPGAFTFIYGDHQYLIASSLPDECPSGDSTLYKITGTEAIDLERVGCVEAEGVASSQIVGGTAAGDYLYLGDKTSRLFLFEITEHLSTVELSYVSTPMTSYLSKDTNLAIDLDNGIAIEATSVGMSVWDLSDPGDPIELTTVPGNFNRAAVHCQYAFVARKGFKNSERTFDISDPTNPVELSQSFWDPGHNWNYPTSECAEVQGAIFYPAASTLYLSRYGVLQIVDFNPCGECLSSEHLFADGFESGSWLRWSAAVGVSPPP